MKLYKVLSVIVIVGALLTTVNCSRNSHEIKYKVTNTAGMVDITYTNSSGGTSQANNVITPWEYSFEVKVENGDYFSLYLSAQNKEDNGEVVVTIYVDGDIFKRASCSGDGCTASVSGLLENN